MCRSRLAAKQRPAFPIVSGRNSAQSIDGEAQVGRIALTICATSLGMPFAIPGSHNEHLRNGASRWGSANFVRGQLILVLRRSLPVRNTLQEDYWQRRLSRSDSRRRPWPRPAAYPVCSTSPRNSGCGLSAWRPASTNSSTTCPGRRSSTSTTPRISWSWRGGQASGFSSRRHTVVRETSTPLRKFTL